MSLKADGLYEFGDFRLDPGERRLLRTGVVVQLTPKAFELLVLLVSRSGHLVTREDILREVWPSTFVEEANLTYTVSLLRKALGDDGDHQYIETVPKLGYRFAAPVRSTPSETVTKARPRYTRRALAAAAIVGSGALVAAALWLPQRPQLPAPTVVQLSTERWARGGSFSPDGAQIAYASAGEDGVNWDIRLKIVGEAESRRLTTDPAAEDFPAWSRDGTQIAFLRYHSGTARGLPFASVGTVHLISPLGGPARQLSAFPARLALSWSPDGRWLAVSKARVREEPPGGIHLISVANGEVRAVTFPKPAAFDVSPGFSPDGRELAYAACEGTEATPVCDLRVVSLDADARPLGVARTLPGRGMARISRGWFGLAWSRDGRSIVYSAGSLWRVRADGSAPAEPLELLGRGSSPSTAIVGGRLAFVRGRDADIYQFREGGSPSPVVRSASFDLQPQYSPDGRRIAFVSGRALVSGGEPRPEIWLADADGSNLVRLTRGPGNQQGWPGWSPDGRTIVFDSRAEDGHADIWTIEASGSGLRQMTRDPADDTVPSFSRDGRFVYFTSNRTGRHEIWRAAVSGGADEQVSRNGGSFPFESWDGRTLYYKAGVLSDDRLLGRPTAGGEERTILPCVRSYGYGVGPRGIFHHECGTAASPLRPLRHWDAATQQDRFVASLEADWIGGLGVSPDGKSVIYGRGEAASDLMMIENFR